MSATKCATTNGATGITSEATVGALIEHVANHGEPLVTIVRAAIAPEQTTFVTPNHYAQQVGFVVYPAGGEVARHEHRPIERRVVGTSEVLIVKEGRCEMDIYDSDHAFVATRAVSTGDVIIINGGGHAFRMQEDTTLIEVKQGPYSGLHEKELF